MGKIADKYAEISGWDEDKWNSFNWDRPLPKFKDKEIAFDSGIPGAETMSIYDAIKDPEFKKAFDAMSDEDKESILIQISNTQPDILDHKKVLAMLDDDDSWMNTAKLPKFKGKTVSFEPGEGELNANDVFENPDFKKEFVNASDDDKKSFLAMIDNLQWPSDKKSKFTGMLNTSDKPHDKGLAGEITPEEDFMQRAAAGKVPATSSVLAGDLTPEEIEMIQMMRAKKQSKDTGLANSQTLSDERFKNITNRLAKNLSKHRW